MSLFTFTSKKLVLVSCPSEEGLTFVCFLFLVGITSAWFSFLEEKYHQLMSLGFMTWCEKGKGQRWALPGRQSGSGPPGRSSSFLPAECLPLHGSPGGLPQTQSLIHSRSAGHPLSASATTPALYPAYSSFVLMAIELQETSSLRNKEKQRTNWTQSGLSTCHCLTQSPEPLSSVEAAHMFFRAELSFVSLQRLLRSQVFSKQLYQK